MARECDSDLFSRREMDENGKQWHRFITGISLRDATVKTGSYLASSANVVEKSIRPIYHSIHYVTMPLNYCMYICKNFGRMSYGYTLQGYESMFSNTRTILGGIRNFSVFPTYININININFLENKNAIKGNNKDEE